MIDFGIVESITNPDQFYPRHLGTAEYMDTNFQSTTSIIYDWYCALISILELIDFITKMYDEDSDSDTYVFVLSDQKNLPFHHLAKSQSEFKQRLSKYLIDHNLYTDQIDHALTVIFLIKGFILPSSELNEHFLYQSQHYTITSYIRYIITPAIESTKS